MSKTACTVQCPQCPFRRTSLPGYLGGYTTASVSSSIWHGEPFFCHTKIDYESAAWKERAERGGKLCLGGLRFAALMGAPDREVTDPEVLAARQAVAKRTDVECMKPNEFGEWHIKQDMAEFGRRRAAAGLTHSAFGEHNASDRDEVPDDGSLSHLPDHVAAEVRELQSLADLIPQRDYFGGDNRAKLDAEIECLIGEWDQDEVYERFPVEPRSAEDDPDGLDEDLDFNLNQEIVSDLCALIEWRDGHSKQRPSDGWRELVESKAAHRTLS